MTYAEPMVARVIGVQKAHLVGVRKAKLARETDWTLDKAVVVYTEAGLAKILVELGLANAAFVWPTGETADQSGETEAEPRIEAISGSGVAMAPAIEPEKIAAIAAAVAVAGECARVVSVEEARPLVTLVVARTSRNPSILYARPVDGEEVTVKVSYNAHFLPGMQLQARAPVAGASLYYFEGRVPRWRGRY